MIFIWNFPNYNMLREKSQIVFGNSQKLFYKKSIGYFTDAFGVFFILKCDILILLFRIVSEVVDQPFLGCEHSVLRPYEPKSIFLFHPRIYEIV